MEQVNASGEPGQSPHRGSFDRVHEKTLLGAIDSYMSTLVHVRPYLAHSYRQVLEALAERWLDEEGANAVDAVDAAWLNQYVAEDASRRAAVQDFRAWVEREGLLER